MGLLDDLKHKAGELGDKAKEGLDAAKDKAGDLLGDATDALGDARDKAGDLVEDVKDRFGHDDEQSPLGESDDIAPDAGTLNPTDVPEEDDDDSADDPADDPADDAADDADTVSAGDLDAEEASDPDPGDSASASGEASGAAVPTPAQVFGSTGGPGHVVEPGVEADVDPYDTPLTESVGDTVAGSDAEDPRA